MLPREQQAETHLISGPKLQIELTAIILRWRQYRHVFVADIVKMYHQIQIHSSDADYQRIVWRPSSESDICNFRLSTVTYGTTSAPFLALRVIKQIATDEGQSFPRAVSVLEHQTYVDDCIFGADDAKVAIETRNQTIKLLSRGGFRLRKWASNDNTLLTDIDPSNHSLATIT